MGYGDFGRFNKGLSETPVLDALIDESVCLRQQYTASPVCNPSRATLLTGRYPHRTGSIDTLEWRGLERLALRERTLADMLREAGYATGLIGKWHLGAFDPRYHPHRRGFDETLCFRGGMHDYFDWRLETNDGVLHADGRYLTDVWTDAACDFVQRHAKGPKPFFLHLTYNAPHTPIQCPEQDVAPFRELAESGQVTPAVATLYGMIRRMDRGIGRLLETLDRSGAAENTLVVFSSDNGPQFGGGEAGDRLNRFNCHFNGSKGHVFEGGIRVPAIVRWPDGLEPGRTLDHMVHFVDWLPTLLHAAGVALPTDGPAIDGLDVWPVIRDGSGDVCTRRFWQWNRYTPLPHCNAAMRDGPYKLLYPRIPEAFQVPDIAWLRVCMYEPERMAERGLVTDPLPPREVPEVPAQLYNLDDDPCEQNDLAEAHPDIARRMIRELDNWFEDVEAERRTIAD